MGRFLLATHGTTGDIFPFLALGVELRDAGHAVSLAVDRSYRSLVEEHGLDCVAVDTGRDERRIIRETLRSLPQLGNPLRHMRATLDRLYAPTVLPFYRAITGAAGTADAIIAHAAVVGAITAARDLDRALVILMFGNMIPSAYYPPQLPPPFRAPTRTVRGGLLARTVNRALWEIFRQAVNRTYLRDINRGLRANGLDPITDMYEPIHLADLDLVAVSRHLMRPAPDWPDHCRVTGYLFNHPNLDWTPDEELRRFMEDGEPPIVFSFGSVVVDDADRWTRIVVDAVEAAGRRKAVLQSGWAGLGAGDVPDHVRVVGFASHAWMFERAACVVHHGGAGTSGSACRAGVPSVVVTFMNDEYMWGDELRRAGVCRTVLRPEQVDARRLGRAIAETLDAPELRHAARELGARIRAEDGVASARREIEALVEGRPG